MGTASSKKLLKQVSGALTEEAALLTSAGAGDANRIPALNASGVLDQSIVNAVVVSAGAGSSGMLPALDASGLLDVTVMPPGISADVAVITASEALAAGDFVNIWSSTGFKVRKADATAAGKHAMGFVLASVLSSGAATVYLSGPNTAVSGQSPGDVFLTTTAGQVSATPPSGSGNVSQYVGTATSATSVDFNPGRPITLA
jgi:hypothetical protein